MRLLLVSPGFHGYSRSMERAFRDRGHDVATHVYDDLPTFSAKVGHKLRHELPALAGADTHSRHAAVVTRSAVSALHSVRPDAVVVVKGDLLTDDFWDAVGSLPRVLWLYDEIRRMRHSVDRLLTIGPLASYSLEDTTLLTEAGAVVRHVPGAFDPSLAPSSPVTTDDVVFIGARYPGRERTLVSLASAGVPVRAYGRDWSRHWYDRARTWDVRRPPVAAERDIALTEGYRVIAGARAAINLHERQDGFTMRTYEIPGVGGLQLIDRADVAPLYEPDVEVAVFSSVEEARDLASRAAVDHAWAGRIRESGRRRTLAEHTFAHRIAVLEELLG
ncbi:CgeB family protein [Nocardioides montaniterrae]